ncbi:MAG: glycosyltransferase [Bacteroidales bacterium]|nr:glycosyltransferase [Bacteroidales bacterium]
MPKILFLDFEISKLFHDQSFKAGGSTIQIYSWIKGLTAQKYRVGIFDSDNVYQGKYGKYIDKLNMYNRNYGIPMFRWVYYRMPWLLKEIKRYRPDYIYQSCAGFSTAIGALISTVLKIPLIYRAANDIDSDERIKKLSLHSYWGYKWGINHANYILCQNQYQYNNFVKRFPPQKIAIVHNPFYMLQENIPYIQKTEGKYIAWVGLFQYQKNLMGLYCVAKHLPGFSFLIAGCSIPNGGQETEHAKKKLETLSNVKFVGYLSRKHIRAFLSKAMALLNTSHYEGFSNTFLEALSVGTPVITTRKVDPDHIIERNHLGSVCESISDLPETIREFISLDSMDSIRTNCINYVKKYHDPVKLARTMIRFLEHDTK